MAGRPITNTSHRAEQRREQMRRARELANVRPVHFNPKPLASVLANWRTQ